MFKRIEKAIQEGLKVQLRFVSRIRDSLIPGSNPGSCKVFL